LIQGAIPFRERVGFLKPMGRSGESPRQKTVAVFWLPVRKIATVEAHEGHLLLSDDLEFTGREADVICVFYFS